MKVPFRGDQDKESVSTVDGLQIGHIVQQLDQRIAVADDRTQALALAARAIRNALAHVEPVGMEQISSFLLHQ